MNTIYRSLGPPVEFNETNVCSTELLQSSKHWASKNIFKLRILNTIKPVTRAVTTMDAAKPVRISANPQGPVKDSPYLNVTAPSAAS